MVDLFRASRYAEAIVEEALTLKPRPQVIWMQLGVRNDAAAAKAEAGGIKVVMDRCPKIEYGRLSSEIGWIGRQLPHADLEARAAPGQGRAAHVAQSHDDGGRLGRCRRARPQGQLRRLDLNACAPFFKTSISSQDRTTAPAPQQGPAS